MRTAGFPGRRCSWSSSWSLALVAGPGETGDQGVRVALCGAGGARHVDPAGADRHRGRVRQSAPCGRHGGVRAVGADGGRLTARTQGGRGPRRRARAKAESSRPGSRLPRVGPGSQHRPGGSGCAAACRGGRSPPTASPRTLMPFAPRDPSGTSRGLWPGPHRPAAQADPPDTGAGGGAGVVRCRGLRRAPARCSPGLALRRSGSAPRGGDGTRSGPPHGGRPCSPPRTRAQRETSTRKTG